MATYERGWLRSDVVAAVVIWSVVVPQAVAYAQIAGLPPEAGLMAAPGALLAYALIGQSKTLVVSATTATSAVSAAAVAPLADGDVARYAALSAALALITAAVLVGAGLLRLGAISDLVSKPVMTGFLFGLGLTITVGQLPKVFGVEGGDGNFFPMLADLIRELPDLSGWTTAVGVGSIVLLVALRRLAPAIPGTLVVLVLGILLSAAFDLAAHGVAVVGDLPRALPHPSWPEFRARDAIDLLPAAFGIMLVTTEAVGVARTLATMGGYSIDPNRELVAIGGSNLLAGLSQGFVQSGGASQTLAAERAGGKSQLASIVAAGLIVLTGAFLAPLFEDLPQATLGAIVVVAIATFFRVDELRRFARIRTSAIVFALAGLVGVLVFGVLPGLIVAAGLSLIVVIKELSRPELGALARDPSTGAWGRTDRHPDWEVTPGFVVARVDGPLFYANVENVKERLLDLVRQSGSIQAVVLELAESPDLDLSTVDALAELSTTLAKEGIELRLVSVREPALHMLRRAGLADQVTIVPTLDAALGRIGST